MQTKNIYFDTFRFKEIKNKKKSKEKKWKKEEIQRKL